MKAYLFPIAVLFWFPCSKPASGNRQLLVGLWAIWQWWCAHIPWPPQVGVDVFRKVAMRDAAVAVQLALLVTFPEAGNIGGGGFMVYRSTRKAKSIRSIIGREGARQSHYRHVYRTRQKRDSDGASTGISPQVCRELWPGLLIHTPSLERFLEELVQPDWFGEEWCKTHETCKPTTSINSSRFEKIQSQSATIFYGRLEGKRYFILD